MKRNASAVWKGTLREGSGAITTESNALVDYPYSFKTRFENQKGTNPEELIAAAHAACFTMAFSAELEKANFSAEYIETDATVSIEKIPEGGWTINEVHLAVKGEYASREGGASVNKADIAGLAETVKENCPVSKLLKAKITLEVL